MSKRTGVVGGLGDHDEVGQVDVTGEFDSNLEHNDRPDVADHDGGPVPANEAESGRGLALATGRLSSDREARSHE
jgi:hypothetical protein